MRQVSKYKYLTWMHSSRMRTDRCSGRWWRGGALHSGTPPDRPPCGQTPVKTLPSLAVGNNKAALKLLVSVENTYEANLVQIQNRYRCTPTSYPQSRNNSENTWRFWFVVIFHNSKLRCFWRKTTKLCTFTPLFIPYIQLGKSRFC